MGSSWNIHILSTARGFKKCSQNEGRVGYLPLESNIRNSSSTVFLNTKVDMLFFTIKHCQFFTLTKGHGAGVMAWKCKRMEICNLILHFSSFLSLSFSPFSFAFSCAFRMPGHLSRGWLVLTGLSYKYTMVNRTFLVRNFDHFFLLRKPFAPFLYLLESSCRYYYHPA